MHRAVRVFPVVGVAVLAAAVGAALWRTGSVANTTAAGASTAGSARVRPESSQALDNVALPVPRDFELSHVAPEPFAAGLGKDPARIFEFVRDEIAFEPYVGSLRGPRGTLLAMAGNSVDRAALLASLLQSAGVRVRFARGTLPDALIDQLLASLWSQRPRSTPVGDGSREAIRPLADQLIADIKRDATLVQDELKRSNLLPAADAFTSVESLRKETREHYWVEIWKDGAWTPMDPSLPSSVPGRAYVKAESFLDSLPDAAFHRVDVRVRIEEVAAGTSTTRLLLQYAAKAADLSGVDLILGHQPVPVGNDPSGQLRPVLFIGQHDVAGSPFSLKTADAGGFGGLIDAFGGGDDATPVAAAETVEMDFVAPDGRRVTVVRDIFDRIGKDRRAAHEQVSAADLRPDPTANLTSGLFDFFFTTGAIDRRHLEHLQSGGDTSGPIDVGAGLRRLSTVFCVLSDALTGRIAGASGPVIRSYFDTPRVQISEWGTRDGRLHINLDLRRDSARLVASQTAPALGFRVQILRGVAGGHIERLVTDHLTRAVHDGDLHVDDAMSTGSLFAQARTTGTPFTLVTRDADVGSQIPADARARIVEALGSNHWVVAPQRPVDVGGAERLAWWQIDRRSGETVGVTDDGLHGAQATVETVIIRRDENRYAIAFRVNGRFISTQGRLFQFQSLAEAQSFASELGSLLADLDYTWYMLPF